MSYNASYWFARGYYDGRSTGVEANDIPEDQIFSYQSGFQTGVQDYNELEDNYESALLYWRQVIMWSFITVRYS